MERIIFAVHSVIDVITNSSTELYIIDAQQELDLVRAMIQEKEKEFPPEYGGHVSVQTTAQYELQEMYNWPNEEECVAYLKAIGYTVEKPEVAPVIRYITISCERGCMNPSLRNFIESTFTVIEHDEA